MVVEKQTLNKVGVELKTLSSKRILSNRSEFNTKFPEGSFPETQRYSSTELQKSAWEVYRDTSQGTKPIVMGRRLDTEAGEALGFQRLRTDIWTQEVNNAWVQGGIDARRRFYVGSKLNTSNFRAKAKYDLEGNFIGRGKYPETVFFKEMKQLRNARYRLVGDYMYPPKT